MPRKPSYTDATANEVLAGIAVGLTDGDACIAAGISEDTWGRWMKSLRGAPADMAERVARARKQRVRIALGGIRKAAEQGDWRAWAELLDRTAHDYRKHPTQLDVLGAIKHEHSGRIEYRDLSHFTDEEVRNMAAIAERVKAERGTST